MAYLIACADMGSDCPGSFITESRDELMEHAVIHANAAHKDMEMNADMMAELEKTIKTV